MTVLTLITSVQLKNRINFLGCVRTSKLPAIFFKKCRGALYAKSLDWFNERGWGFGRRVRFKSAS